MLLYRETPAAGAEPLSAAAGGEGDAAGGGEDDEPHADAVEAPAAAEETAVL